ncbi:MAG: hypothetical protein DI563_01180 [Variovorax paradoxus]|uniref:Uncharacterized protein n=1 Tax=Variovorax paradoxus TaxID=34073 RepID=A0A2W5QPA9_VARPD|nr:MAG: hypothetical protein DI563_01180 [Variovorax paradoxus]
MTIPVRPPHSSMRARTRHSAVREAVLAVVRAAPEESFSAVEIYRWLIGRERSSLRTVYRVLGQLEMLGHLAQTSAGTVRQGRQERWQLSL